MSNHDDQFLNGGDDDVFEVDASDEKLGKLAPGEYTFVLSGLEKKNSKAGDPMIVFEFAEKESGSKLKVYALQKPTALWKFLEVTAALGFPRSDDGKVKLVKSQAIGRQVLGTVAMGAEFNGAPQAELKKTKLHPAGFEPAPF